MANSTSAGNKKALLIAVRSVNKKDFPPLQHAHEDAESLKRLLIDKFNYPEANVVLMKHDVEHPEHLWPSRKNILKQIKKMVVNASSNDQFFFYYSGHGNQVTCEHHTETDGKDEVIYAYTGHHIVDNKLRKVLVEPLPRGSKLFALWDSCHSETILDLDHYKCNKLLSGDAVRTGRKSLTGRFLLDFVSRPRTLPINNQQPIPRGRTGNPSLTLNSILVRPQSPSSWLPRMFIDNSPSPLLRVLSPVSLFKCSGDCRKLDPEEQEVAHVVSLSACRDNEYAYDDNETHGTVTKFFIECVSQDPKPSLLALLTYIKFAFHLLPDSS
ncbi:peptidase C14, caspase domain-containing protein [Suillus bovinus]|uniref:peptidase C14, caspase domain-containing protein n=1 Tax=Suillus bovinus TaxID=48563 RepID=UPI001B87CB37|nr:peptidase C14, caspase domain-containing protein [Suillus bovinus]KAG2154243.1 peptidase C14, caspase domain-containing protein [Suillus bovinus]